MEEDVNIQGNNRTQTNSTQQFTNDRPVPNKNEDDKVREEIRGNERHILFHFFTLFSISFVCGILLIHLSLWMNSYMHAVMSPGRTFDGENNKNGLFEEYTDSFQEPSETYYLTVYTQDETIKDVFLSPFYYTGTYFGNIIHNVTHTTYHKFDNFSAVK